jgi:hypothetical protein
MIRALFPTAGDVVAVAVWLVFGAMYAAVRRRQVLDDLERHDIELVGRP